MKSANLVFDDAKFRKLVAQLSSVGLEILGGFRVGAGCENAGSFGLMIINAGRAMWPFFRDSEEWYDCQDNPLDRWSERVISTVALDTGAELYFPSQKPFKPFQQWAIKAGGLGQSPIGILIHQKYGLWFGLRGALIFPLNVSIQLDEKLIQVADRGENICQNCIDKPCLTHCPASAFSNDGLSVDACFSHLRSDRSPDCMALGCVARGVCPVGYTHQYGREQLQFHMNSYVG